MNLWAFALAIEPSPPSMLAAMLAVSRFGTGEACLGCCRQVGLEAPELYDMRLLIPFGKARTGGGGFFQFYTRLCFAVHSTGYAMCFTAFFGRWMNKLLGIDKDFHKNMNVNFCPIRAQFENFRLCDHRVEQIIYMIYKHRMQMALIRLEGIYMR